MVASRGPIQAQDAGALAVRAQQEKRQNPNNVFTSWLQELNSPEANYIFVAVPIMDVSGQAGLVILGNPIDPYGLFGRLLFNLLAGSLLTLVIALVGGFWLADRAMRPVHTITQAAGTLAEGF